MEKGTAMVVKRTLASCGRGSMHAAATDSTQNVNYTKVTRPPRLSALRTVALMHWKEVSCNHDGMVRMASDHAAYSSTGSGLPRVCCIWPLLALRAAERRVARNTICASQSVNEKHTDIVERIRNFIGHDEA